MFDKVSAHLKSIASTIEDKLKATKLEKEMKRVISNLEGDKDYDVFEGHPIILRLRKIDDGTEVLRFLAAFWVDDTSIPFDKIAEKGMYIDIIPLEERKASGLYGTYFEYHVRKEVFALITTKDFWRCACANFPVKAVWHDHCLTCGRHRGSARHELRLIDHMI